MVSATHAVLMNSTVIDIPASADAKFSPEVLHIHNTSPMTRLCLGSDTVRLCTTEPKPSFVVDAKSPANSNN